MSTRTEDYYFAVKWHRDGLREIWKIYNDRMTKLKPHAGSEYYRTEEQKAAETRDSAIKKLKEQTAVRFDRALEGMRQSAKAQPMIAPTADQLALLQTLKLRKKLTRDELEKAANSFKGCPAAMTALGELAEQHGIYGGQIYYAGGESSASIQEHIDSLLQSARFILRLEKPDSRAERVLSPYDPHWNADEVKLFKVDFDAEDTRDAMARYGGVQDFASFSAAVDGQ